MSENDFTKQREKWERWLQERQAAGTADEPLLVFVDDEPFQRNMRYYEMRLQKHPGRNILLFENAAEAVEFIRFATEKQLYLGAVVSDFDNYPVSTVKGSEVLEAAIEYGKTRDHPVIKLLISSIYRPISPFYEGNENIYAFNTSSENFAECRRQGGVDSFVKNDLDIERRLADAPKIENGHERQKLIPDLIFSMRMIDALLNKFNAEFEPYKDLVPPPHPNDVVRVFSSELMPQDLDPAAVDLALSKRGKFYKKPELQKQQTIADIYAPPIEMIGKVERSIEDMLKVWALVKGFEQSEIVRLGLETHSPNPDADEPEDPLNVRILGNLFLDEFRRIQLELGKYGSQLFAFDILSEAIRADEKFGDKAAREEIARKVTHNLKGPMAAIQTQIANMAKAVEQYIENPPQILMQEAQEGEYRFDHYKLHKMTARYLADISRPEFAYIAANASANDIHATTDRTENTPGQKAPKRETIACPMTEAERVGSVPVKGIKKGLMRQLLRIIEKDEINRDRTTVAGQDNAANLAELMQTLKKQLAAERQQQGK